MPRFASFAILLLGCALAVSAAPGDPIAQNKVPCQLYTVVQGDFSSAVATKFGVELKDLLAANPEVIPDSLSIDQQLRIPPWDDTCVGAAVKPVTKPGLLTASLTPAEPDPTPANPAPVAEPTPIAVATLTPTPDTTAPIVTPTPTAAVPAAPVPVAPGAVDYLNPDSGANITMTLVGRPAVTFQTDIKAPFLSELARALGVEEQALTLLDVVPVNAIAGRRLSQAVPEKPIVTLVVRGASEDPEGLAANATAVLTPGSTFDTQTLPLYQLSLQGPATLTLFKDGQPLAATPEAQPTTPAPATPEAQPAPATTPAPATPVAAPASSGGGSLSTGAIVCISIGSVAFAAAALLAVMVVRRRRASAGTHANSVSMHNPTYDIESKPSAGHKVEIDATAMA